MKKILNEIEIRLRKEEGLEVKEKREKKTANLGRARKLAVLVTTGGKGGSDESSSLVIAGVFHVLAEDNTGEFDPYYIERMKTAL